MQTAYPKAYVEPQSLDQQMKSAKQSHFKAVLSTVPMLMSLQQRVFLSKPFCS